MPELIVDLLGGKRSTVNEKGIKLICVSIFDARFKKTTRLPLAVDR
jgi:hypothetical protein